MSLVTFHLANTKLATTAGALLRPPTAANVAGLHRAECMTVMKLGSRSLSPARLQLRHLAVLAYWESDRAIDRFLTDTELGRSLAKGWHVRLEFLRRWGRLSGFEDLPASVHEEEFSAPVVAVTLARLKLPQVARFVRWGKPVEELVRDHPGTTLALAAMRPPRTIGTFSVWRSVREMRDMVQGEGNMARPDRHAAAMVERERKDFHHEFTTLRFRVLAEHGTWEGRSNIVPR